MISEISDLGNLGSKKAEKYYCQCCDYSTSYESKWKRHLNTKKHNDNQMVTDDNNLGKKGRKGASNKWICGCGKSYKYKSGLSRHKSTCTYIEEENTDSNLAIKEEKTESDEKTVTLTHAELQTIITGAVKAASGISGQSIHGDNNNQIQNNFNIQLFLNEQCANALSIQDFAKQLKLTMDDLSLMNENEPKSITNIIVKNLKDYTEVERPFHHHKKKWYIKDKNEGWDKEGKNNGEAVVKHTKTAVSQKAGPTFVNNNPDWLTNQRKGEKYAETMAVAMKEVSERNTNKILKNVKQNVEVGKE